MTSVMIVNWEEAYLVHRGGFTMDSFGRRKTVMLGAFINLVGATLQASAQNLAMILVGRILAGWAVGVLSVRVWFLHVNVQ